MRSEGGRDPAFAGYEKIAESADQWRLESSAYRLFRRVSWVVTEKIHGANLCFVTDGVSVRCANRRRFLDEDDDFFGFQRVRDALGGAVRETYARVQARHPEVTGLSLYGELFGGKYPHPDVAPVTGVQPVQTGIWYAPGVQFCAFDLRVEAGDGARRYLDYEEAVHLWERVGVFYAVPLRTGTYEQAMEHSIRFDSTVPRRLGLPPLPPGTNLAEGVVVKPVREIQAPSERGMIRPILKRKIPEFAEDRRFHEAEKWTTAATGYDGTVDLLKWEVYCRVTENRLRSAVSKIGMNPNLTEELSALLAEEIVDEVQAAKGDEWRHLNGAQRSELLTYIHAEVRRLVKEHPV
jgi:Rnl2 family RNA ligase